MIESLKIDTSKFKILHAVYYAGDPFHLPGYRLFIRKDDDKPDMVHEVMIEAEEANKDFIL